MPLLLEIVAPDREVVVTRAEEIVAPGVEGDFGVLPGHTSMLTLLRTGILWYRSGGVVRHMVIRKGYAEVRPDQVLVLAEGVYLPEELAAGPIAEELRRAEEDLKEDIAQGRDHELSQERVTVAQVKHQALNFKA